jgi:3-deoxy-D-manno-octulosonic acid kinase
VRATGFLAESLPPALAKVGGGRGGAHYLELPGGARAVLREYLRGGLPGRFLRDLHLGSARAFAELRLHEELARRGVPTLRVLAARTVSVGGVFFRHALLTEEVAARDLVQAATERPERRAALCAAAGRAVRALHDAGLDHADLHPGNLLVRWDGDAPEVLVIDLDRGSLRSPLPPARRARSLVRFARYLRRHDVGGGGRAAARDEIGFLRAYLRLEGAERGERRRQLRTFRGQLRGRVAWDAFWHGLWWRGRRRA